MPMGPKERLKNHPRKTKERIKKIRNHILGKESLVEGSITFSQLGQLIIFLVLVAAGVYLTITVRHVNAAVKNIGAILKGNQEAINQVIPNIATASKNAVVITNELRAGLDGASKAIETADQIATYAMVIGETAKALANLLTVTRKL